MSPEQRQKIDNWCRELFYACLAWFLWFSIYMALHINSVQDDTNIKVSSLYDRPVCK